MEKEIEEILRKHNLKGILPMQRCKRELLNLFSVSKKLCDCEKPKYILNEVKQELMCKCGNRFNVC
jgi:hypothetical protein